MNGLNLNDLLRHVLEESERIIVWIINGLIFFGAVGVWDIVYIGMELFYTEMKIFRCQNWKENLTHIFLLQRRKIEVNLIFF